MFIKGGIGWDDKDAGIGVGRFECACNRAVSGAVFDGDQCAAFKIARKGEVRC